MNALDRENGFAPGKLWSLLDLMQHFDLSGFIGAYTKVMAMRGAIDQFDQNRDWVDTSIRSFGIMKADSQHLVDETERLELPLSNVTAVKIRDHYSRGELRGERVFWPTQSYISVRSSLDGLPGRLSDELRTRVFVTLDVKYKAFFAQQAPLFGDEVETKFPLAAEDISEAGKCLALGRYTATVFHLMRAMESMVLVLGEKLKVTIVDSASRELTWGKILGNMKGAIEAMPSSPARDEWSETLALLYHVKQSWRNSTMHPKQTYTEAEAVTVFDATEAYATRLARLV